MALPRSFMLHSTLSLLLSLLCLFAAYVEVCDAVAAVDVYRMIQYDLNGIPFGSRRASVNHYASSLLLYHNQAADLSRSVLLFPIAKDNITVLNDLLQSKRTLGGLILILPSKFSNQGSTEESGDAEDLDAEKINEIADLEQSLIHTSIPYPVYFAYEDENLRSLLTEVQENDAAGRHATAISGGYKLVISTAEPRKLQATTLINLQGWLSGFKSDEDASQPPTVAIVASYDTFGVAPALSNGSDSNGSGVVAVLELARLFSRLYSNPSTQGKFNLLFGLTSGGPYNYNGTAKWLRNFDQRVRESIDYAICLNSIGSNSNELWLHVSKPPESTFIRQIYDGLESIANELGLQVKIRHKKINISNPRVAWEHEQFSRFRVTGATLSKLDKPANWLEHSGGLLDRRMMVDTAALARVVKLVAESLARHIYGHEEQKIEFFADESSLAISQSYIRMWLKLLSQTPRVAAFLSKTDPILVALQKELSLHTKDVSIQQESLDDTLIFYDLPKAELSIYRVASVTMDFIILMAVLAYLFVLFVILVVSTKGLDDLISVFRRPPTKKFKSL